MKLPGRWHGQIEMLRQSGKSCLVDKVFDQRRFGDNKTESFGELFTMARDKTKLGIFLIEQDRAFALCSAETQHCIQQRFAVLREVLPSKACARVARVKR